MHSYHLHDVFETLFKIPTHLVHYQVLYIKKHIHTPINHHISVKTGITFELVLLYYIYKGYNWNKGMPNVWRLQRNTICTSLKNDLFHCILH